MTYYNEFAKKVDEVKRVLNRPLTYSEKILYANLFDSKDIKAYKKGVDYANFKVGRVAMQDATAQMALLQFMNAGKDRSVVPASVHCDHLIESSKGEKTDLATAEHINNEVYSFLSSVTSKYGIDFWGAGSGIIHQIVYENYATPGAMMVGTDSHTPNAGGIGMIAIGVGGADAVDVMIGLPWELKMPMLIGVRLSGKLSGWCSPKDLILKLAGILTVKGGTNSIIEYFGEGISSICATGRSTICNMGAEVGATTSIFAYDKHSYDYLVATGRKDLAEQANNYADYLRSDDEVLNNPEAYYDRIIDINLSELEPYLNGPFSPDFAHKLSDFKDFIIENNYPEDLSVGLIGSCTNSSYNDLARAASIAEWALNQGLKPKVQLLINPGSELVKQTVERDGILDIFKNINAMIMANACGACIGQWKREPVGSTERNSIVTSFNRNFAKRADGNPNTFAFVASPEIVIAFVFAGKLTFNPLTDTIDGVKLIEPKGDFLPKDGFQATKKGYIAPKGAGIEVEISKDSARLQKLEPFTPWDGEDLIDMPLLIKCKGKCTTDHISMAGAWLRFRGHLDNISDNLLLGAVNAYNERTGEAKRDGVGEYANVAQVARSYKAEGRYSVVVAEENYGEGSSREHAAMEPRFLNIRAVIVKSFARIHETNLKKQGMLALTFAHSEDYDKIEESDKFSILGLNDFQPGRQLSLEIRHSDGRMDKILLNHTYNSQQIQWFKAGSALNAIKNEA